MATLLKPVRRVAKASSGARNGSAIGTPFFTAQSGVNEVPKHGGALADMLVGVTYVTVRP